MTARLTALIAAVATFAGCGSPAADRAQPPAHAAPPAAAAATSRSECVPRLVSSNGKGPLRIGAYVDSLRRACNVVRDTTVPQGRELRPERLVTVALGGADTAVATVRRGRVMEVMLAGQGFATADSLGIGTPLRRLLGVPGVRGYLQAGRLLVWSEAKCGLAFGFPAKLDGVAEGVQDSAALRRLPAALAVDRIRIDFCLDDDPVAEDDSTFDVQTDSVLLARDLDGNGRTDFVVAEARPFRGSLVMYAFRLAVYRDSIPAARTPAWATPWSMEGDERGLHEVVALASGGSLVVLWGNGGDYTSETLLAMKGGTIDEVLTHGEDYGNGFLDLRKEGGAVIVDASQSNLLLRGEKVLPELECPNGEWAAVRMRYDEASRRFVPERPRCVKAKYE